MCEQFCSVARVKTKFQQQQQQQYTSSKEENEKIGELMKQHRSFHWKMAHHQISVVFTQSQK